jgi:hypothetical protein
MILKHYRLTGLALALVVAALLAPAASARPIDQVSPQAQPAHSSTPTSRPQQPAVVPNEGGFSARATTLESPNAILNGAPQRQQVDPLPGLPHGVDYSAYDVGKPSTPPAEVPVAPVDSNPGFDWGDAGIGAGAAFALTMIGLGGLLVLSNRRQRAEQPAPTA